VPDPTPNQGSDGKARRFGRAVILLGAVVALVLIALFISPKSEPRPQPPPAGGAFAR